MFIECWNPGYYTVKRVWSFERKTYTWSSCKSSHSWNLADFMKSSGCHLKSSRFQVKSTHNLIKSDVSTKTIQFDECRRVAMTLDFMKSTRFHGWNPPDFTGEIWVKSTRFHGWNPPDFMGEIQVKSARFHPWNPGEIWWISPMKSKDQLPGMVSPMFCQPYIGIQCRSENTIFESD